MQGFFCDNNACVLSKKIICIAEGLLYERDFRWCQFTWNPTIGKSYAKSNCVVWILGWRCHRTIILRNWQWHGHHHQRRALSINDEKFILPKLVDMDVDDIWLLLDGAKQNTMDILHEGYRGIDVSREQKPCYQLNLSKFMRQSP